MRDGGGCKVRATQRDRRVREARARICDTVTTKTTRGEIAQARVRAPAWAPGRER
jgi:hypothetical protein